MMAVLNANPGIGGGGCILRDTKGEMQCALADYYGEVTNTFAEVKALCQGLWIEGLSMWILSLTQ